MSDTNSAYFIPEPSRWPIVGSVALFTTFVGTGLLLNGVAPGILVLVLGFAAVVCMFYGWFSDVIGESLRGNYNKQVDTSFHWGMTWFIFSEVMFFAAFFGALFWVRVMSVPDLANLEHTALLWPGFEAHWPSAGPAFAEKFSPMGAWGIPAINTMLLLSSGVTV